MWGIVLDSYPTGPVPDTEIAQMKELGVGYARFWLGWDQTEPNLATYNAAQDRFGVAGSDQPTDLTRALVTDHPEWIDQYAFPERPDSPFHGLVDWSSVDAKFDQLIAAGITPFPLIGDATTAPRLAGSADAPRVAPEALDFRERDYVGITREAYLAHIQLYVAAAARRYSEPGKVTWWNLENELNVTYLHVTLMGWRVGTAWLDDAFVTDLLATLHRGIKGGSPKANGTNNISPGDPDWLEDLAAFAPYLDAIGLGTYPNYATPYPLRTSFLIDAVKAASALGRKLGKPVFVMETSYPTRPESRGWNEALQDEYVATAPRESIAAGASAYFHFMLTDWNNTQPDTALQAVEGSWGLVRLDGTLKPSFATYRDVIAGKPLPSTLTATPTADAAPATPVPGAPAFTG